MFTRDEVLTAIIPSRLDALATLTIVLRLRMKWDGPKPMKLYFDDELQATGTAAAFTNPVIEAGLVHCRALLEFLGLRVDGKDHRLLVDRGPKPRVDDWVIEDFANASGPLPRVTPSDAVAAYNGDPKEAEAALAGVLHLANKGLAHITAGLAVSAMDMQQLEIASRGIPALVCIHLYRRLGVECPRPRISSTLRRRGSQLEYYLSANYTHDKLENATVKDYVDVFEDLWRNNVFAQAKLLLGSPNGDIAAMTVLSSYFEAIEAYVTGMDSTSKSQAFFISGFSRVFRTAGGDSAKAAAAIYKEIRCGLAHEGMVRDKVNYSREGGRPFFLTYRRKPDQTLDIDAGVVSIVVNPQLLYDSIVLHFEDYVRKLRDEAEAALRESFMRTVNRQWALGKTENVIGMTEEESRASGPSRSSP